MQIINPVRVIRSYTQKLRGKPADVFPLLCPVREREWARGWDPLAVYSMSGFAENDCIFTTGEENPESFWVITDFDPCKPHARNSESHAWHDRRQDNHLPCGK